MTWQLATALFIAGMILLVIVWDIIAYTLGGNEATISHICLQTANRYRGFAILVALAVGLLLGHIFLPQHVSK